MQMAKLDGDKAIAEFLRQQIGLGLAEGTIRMYRRWDGLPYHKYGRRIVADSQAVLDWARNRWGINEDD